MADFVLSVQTLLNDNWNPTNTASRTPAVEIQTEIKRKDLGYTNKDLIVLYGADEFDADFAVGGSNKNIVSTVMIDIRNIVSRAQQDLLYVEVRRIIIANEKNDPFGDGEADILDLTEKRPAERHTKFWRDLCKLRVEKFIKTF